MRNNLFSAAAFASLLCAGAHAQGPDVLIPSTSLDGFWALVDRNGDGKYDRDGEAYDWRLDGVDSSPRNVILIGKRFFWIDGVVDKLFWAEDKNANGRIENSEVTTLFDTRKVWSETNTTPNWLQLGANGWLWWTNDAGTHEGIWRSKDLNNDGDAEDVGETVPVIAEPTTPTVAVANIPNTGSYTLALGALDSLLRDPNGGKERWIVEEENTDQSIAFEDKNNDGDFTDAGEVYLFSALYNAGALVKDVNPDVGTGPGKLPSANEIYIHQVDPAATKPTYYLLSRDTTTGNTDAAVVFRAIDNNSDGDINDAGEVKVFWDGKLQAKKYNHTWDMTVTGGKIYVGAELDGTPDFEHLLMLEDKNNDGDANDAGETTVLWTLDADKVNYNPAILKRGTIAGPAGLPGTYQYYGAATCRSSLSATSNHNIQIGSTNFDDKPVLGNTTFKLRTWGAAPSQAGTYAVGLRKLANGIPLDNGGTCRVYMSADAIVLPFTTDATGAFNTNLPIPNQKSLLGVWTYWQGVVLDPTAPAGLKFTVSDAAEVRIGEYSYSRN